MPGLDVERAFRQLVSAVAGPDALPAGGAAGVVAIGMGIALGGKVLDFSPALPESLRPLAGRLAELRTKLMPEFRDDCDAFEALLAAFRVSRDDPARPSTIRGAWLAATEAPVRVASLAAEAESLLARCEGAVNPNLAGDLSAARELVRAGRRIAEANARENASHLDAESARRALAHLPDDQPRS